MATEMDAILRCESGNRWFQEKNIQSCQRQLSYRNYLVFASTHLRAHVATNGEKPAINRHV